MWSITDHAISRYIERIRPRLTREMAARELEALCAGSHRVRTLDDGKELWRTARPRKLRLRVQPGDPQVLMSVLAPFDKFDARRK